MLGSAQIRVEHRGEVWVVSGDYKRDPDPTCADFEVVPCHTFITESTFGLPLYRWPEPSAVFNDMLAWWRRNQAEGRTSVLYAYSIGKAQRLLAGLHPGPGPFLAHQSILDALPVYRAEGIRLPAVELATEARCREAQGEAILLTPPGAAISEWLQHGDPFAFGSASGWMLAHHARRKKVGEKGFVLSDHVDWPALLRTVGETGAERVLVTHGFIEPVVRWFQEHGLEAAPLEPPHAAERLSNPGESPEALA
jgi:putative mRNA 3-end processing factor